MKILDVDLFQECLQRNIPMLDRLSSEMKVIHHAVEGLVLMEEQLKGGNTIYRFFTFSRCFLNSLNKCLT